MRYAPPPKISTSRKSSPGFEISPTTCSTTSSSVTSPATPPYSSTTIASCVCVFSKMPQQLIQRHLLGHESSRLNQLARRFLRKQIQITGHESSPAVDPHRPHTPAAWSADDLSFSSARYPGSLSAGAVTISTRGIITIHTFTVDSATIS